VKKSTSTKIYFVFVGGVDSKVSVLSECFLKGLVRSSTSSSIIEGARNNV